MSYGCSGAHPGGSRPDDFATGVHVGKELIVDKPTSMLAVVPQLIRSDLRLEIEIEVVAAVAPGSATTGQDA